MMLCLNLQAAHVLDPRLISEYYRRIFASERDQRDPAHTETIAWI